MLIQHLAQWDNNLRLKVQDDTAVMTEKQMVFHPMKITKKINYFSVLTEIKQTFKIPFYPDPPHPKQRKIRNEYPSS